VDEYVMKSELPEGLVPIIERAHRIRATFHRTIRAQGSGRTQKVESTLQRETLRP
jgi:hypothetical protein